MFLCENSETNFHMQDVEQLFFWLKTCQTISEFLAYMYTLCLHYSDTVCV